MNAQSKVIKIGNSSGIILPKELMAKLRVSRGDSLHFVELADGSYKITPYNPDFEARMAAAEEIMRDDRDILRELAK